MSDHADKLKIRELERRVRALEKLIRYIVRWIDFWETVGTPWNWKAIKKLLK